jgi:hypothetical protein
MKATYIINCSFNLSQEEAQFNYIVYEPILNYLVYNEDEQCENVE